MTHRGLTRFTSPRPGRPAAERPRSRSAGPIDGNGDGEMAPALTQLLSSRERPAAGEACEMCAAPVGDDHRHVVDLERRALLCACRGCALLFERTDGDGRYRTVPDRYLRVEAFMLPPPAWAALQIPVGLAFIVTNTSLGRPVAFYPSPGGATEADVPPDGWNAIVDANPELVDVEADVEAVLVRADTPASCFVVPVDRCYELVGALRLHWRGFDGGAEVREHMAAFFDDVERRAGGASATASNKSQDRGAVAHTSEEQDHGAAAHTAEAQA